VSDVHVMTTADGCHLFSGCGYPAPSIADFYFKPVFTIGGIDITKPILLAILTVVLILTFFYVAFRKPKIARALDPRGITTQREVAQFMRTALAVLHSELEDRDS